MTVRLKRLDNIDVVCTRRRRAGRLLRRACSAWRCGCRTSAGRAGRASAPATSSSTSSRRRAPASTRRRGSPGAANPPGHRLVRLRGRLARRRDRRARRAGPVGGRDRGVGVVPLPRHARPRGQPRLPDRAAPRPVIDCDVHAVVPDTSVLEPHLDDHWREVLSTTQFSGPTDQAHPPNLATSLGDFPPVDGAAPGTTLRSLQAQVLDPFGIETAILTCDYGVDIDPQPRRRRRARVGGERLARRRVAGPRPAAAGGARRPHRPTGDGGGRGAPARRASGLRRRPPAGPLGDAVRQPRLVAAASTRSRSTTSSLSCTSAARRGCRRPRRAGRRPGSRSTSTWRRRSSPSSEPRRRGDLRPLPRRCASRCWRPGSRGCPRSCGASTRAGAACAARCRGLTRAPSAYVREHVRVGLQPVDGPPDAAQLLRGRRPARRRRRCSCSPPTGRTVTPGRASGPLPDGSAAALRRSCPRTPRELTTSLP